MVHTADCRFLKTQILAVKSRFNGQIHCLAKNTRGKKTKSTINNMLNKATLRPLSSAPLSPEKLLFPAGPPKRAQLALDSKNMNVPTSHQNSRNRFNT